MKSQCHKLLVVIHEIKKKKKTPDGASTVEDVHKLNEEIHNKLSKLFSMEHTLAFHVRPYSDFKGMCEVNLT